VLIHAGWPNVPFSWRHGVPLIAYGLFLECAQYYVPGRFFSLWDILADAAGIGLYLLLVPLITPLFRSITHKPNT